MALLLSPGWTPAQEASGPPAGAEFAGAAASEPVVPGDPYDRRVAGLRSDIEQRRAELVGLDARLEASQGEEARVLQELVTAKEVEILGALGELVELVLIGEEAGREVSELRSLVELELAGITLIVLERLERIAASLGELRASRTSAAPEDVLALERQITDEEAGLQWHYDMALDHIDRLERLQMDTGDEREVLADLLRSRAETLGGRIRLALRRKADLLAQRRRRPDDAALALLLDSLEERLARATSHMTATSRLLARLGLPTAEYRRLLIETTGEITPDIFDREIALGLAGDSVRNLRNWIRTQAPVVLVRLVVFAVIVGAFWLLGLVLRWVVGRVLALRRVHASQLMQATVAAWLGRAVVAVGLIVALSYLGVKTGPLLAGLGIAGFILGFALQDTLGNFAAGAMILTYRPFDVDDVIEASGAFGTVRRMSLVNTTILTFDNQTLVVPNSKIWGDVIRNVTAQDQRRVDLQFRVGYDEDVERVEGLLADAVRSYPGVLAEPEPVARLSELGEWSLQFIVRPWVRRQDYWAVYWGLTREVLRRLEGAGIRMPVPQQRVQIVAPERSSDAFEAPRDADRDQKQPGGSST